jgi:hypothetical protein
MTNEEILSAIPETIKLEGAYMSNQAYVNDKKLSLAQSLKVANHSPTGFNWGYGGSGPAQLSLAVMLCFLPKDQATRLYMDFKFKYIAGLPRTDFIKTVPLREIVASILDERQNASTK